MRRIKFRWSTCMTAWYWHQPSFSSSRSTTGFVSRNSRSSGAWAAVLEACYQGWHLEDVVSFKDHACFAPVAWYGIECREKLPWLRLGCKMWPVYYLVFSRTPVQFVDSATSWISGGWPVTTGLDHAGYSWVKLLAWWEWLPRRLPPHLPAQCRARPACSCCGASDPPGPR